MATREIKTRFAVEGEAPFKASIKAINKEMEAMRSNLKLVESDHRSSANTMEALTKKGEALSKVYDTQKKAVDTLKSAQDNAKAAQESYAKKSEELKQKISATEAELDKLKGSTGDTSAEQERLAKELEELNAELAENEEMYGMAERRAQTWQTQLNKAKVELNNIQDELDKNNSLMEEAKASTDQCATSIDQYGKRVKGAADESENFGQTASSSMDQVATALAAAGVVGTLKEIKDALAACIDASMKFETAITGVFKTVDGTDAELQAISDSIKDLSLNLPSSTTEIAAIAEAAGQLGIQTPDIMSFAETMMNLGNATNLTAEEASVMLAQFASITKLSPDKYENLGSVIVALGNNFETTESKITELAQRMSSAATIAGISQPDIMAIAAAVSSLGIESEAGGSAMSKLIAQMQSAVETGDGLNEFARVANMSAGDFTELWGQNAAQALNKFVVGLNDTERNGASALVVLDQMGISEVRLRNAILSLASSGDKLTNTMAVANRAFNENTALSDEVGKKYATLESQAQIYKNSVSALKIAVGDALNPALKDIAKTGTSITKAITEMIEKHPGIVKLITAVVVGLGTLVLGVTGYTIATNLAAKATAAFTAAMSATPIFMVTAALAACVSGLALFSQNCEETVPSVAELTKAARDAKESLADIDMAFTDSISSANAAYATASEYARALETLEAQGLDTAESQSQYAILVDKINAIMPGLNLTISEQTGLIEGGTKALWDNIAAWKQQMYQQAYQAKYSALIEKHAAAELERNEAIIKSREAQIKLDEIERTRADTLRALDNREKALRKTLEERGETDQSVIDATIEYDQAMITLRQSLGDLATEQAEAQGVVDTFNRAITESNEVVGQYDEEVRVAGEALSLLQEENAGLVGSQGDVNAAIQGTSDVLADAQQAYQETYESARENIAGQYSLFDKVEKKSKITVGQVIKNLKEQAAYMDEYADNLTEAARRGVDQGLLQKLSDGSVESAAILDQLVKTSEEKIGELNDAFAKSQTGADKYANAVAKIKTSTSEALEGENGAEAIVRQTVRDIEGYVKAMDLETPAEQSAKNMILGLQRGIENNKKTATTAIKLVGSAMIGAFNFITHQSSPSRDTEKSSENLMKGYEIPIVKHKPRLVQMMSDLGASSVAAYEQGASELQSRMQSSFSMVSDIRTIQSPKATGAMTQGGVAFKAADYGDKLDRLIDVVDEYLPKLANLQVVTDTGVLAGELAPAIDSALGKQQMLKRRRA